MGREGRDGWEGNIVIVVAEERKTSFEILILREFFLLGETGIHVKLLCRLINAASKYHQKNITLLKLLSRQKTGHYAVQS